MNGIVFVDNPKMGAFGLKKSEFIESIKEDLNNNDFSPWIAQLLTTDGHFAGVSCMYSLNDKQITLLNDKGSVRIFKTIESAAKFFGDINNDDGSVSFMSVNLGLV